MNIASAVVIYILIWWTVFFAVLPWGIKGIWEAPDSHVKGAEPGAPQDPQIARKALRTTWVSAVLWVLVAAFIMSGVVDFRE